MQNYRLGVPVTNGMPLAAAARMPGMMTLEADSFDEADDCR
jgi:hypothetical protein